jgi:HlyD family secretion protein
MKSGGAARTIALISIVGILAIAGALSYWALGRNKATENGFVKGKIERGSIRITVAANGTLEALRTVQVGSQISGQIAALHADYNSVVKKGQLLAEIDPRTFQSQVLTEEAQNAAAQARMQSAQADLINQEANLVQVEANLRVAEVANENTQLLYERSKQLKEKGLVSTADHDIARTNAESSAAKVDQARAAIRQAQAQIRSRQASIEQVKSDIVGAKAQLERAQINLELTKIFSPVDGVVISRNVDIGQTVAASMSAPLLFLIANDLSQMQVKASVDEADIGKVTKDVRVSFTVDAYPNDVFPGRISEVRLEPTTVQNVVTYSVIVHVQNPELKLKPGMTANLTIVIDEHNDVLTVPNTALRFKPTNVTQEQIAEMLQAGRGGAQTAPETEQAQSPEAGSAVPPLPGAAEAPRGNFGGGNFGDGGQRGRGNRGGEGFRGGGGEGFRGGGGRGGRGGGGRGAGGGSGNVSRSGILWTQEADGTLKPLQVRTGLTDGTRTEVFGPNIQEGFEVIVSDLSQVTPTTTQRPATTNVPFGFPNLGGGGRGRGFF